MLWITWIKLIWELRPAFSRLRIFQWFVIIVAAISLRQDSVGVTGLVRSIGISPRYYQRLLDCFQSKAISLEAIIERWISLVMTVFSPVLITMNGRIVLIVDGLKIGKEGLKMPAVKLLYQSFQSNSKAKYIMGHSLQALSEKEVSLTTE